MSSLTESEFFFTPNKNQDYLVFGHEKSLSPSPLPPQILIIISR